jgi:(S)-sulfolactate dehydrogenase
MAEIIITEFMDDATVRLAFAGRDVLYDPALVDRPDELLRAVLDARALIVRNRTQVRGSLLEAAARLSVVGRLGVGLDNIDVEACRKRRIAVVPATGANDDAVAEYVVTAVLMLLRGAWLATPRMIAGEWPRMDLIGREVAGRMLGLLGFGAIARAAAARARALGMVVAAHDPFVAATDPAWRGVERVALDELFERSDAVSLHVPLTDVTRNLVDARLLALMKPRAVLVNAARGGILDEAALVQALQSRRLGGAALDVFAREPVDAASGTAFGDVPNLILTPHIAGVTVESNLRVSQAVAAAVLRHLPA